MEVVGLLGLGDVPSAMLRQSSTARTISPRTSGVPRTSTLPGPTCASMRDCRLSGVRNPGSEKTSRTY
eukprot:scaffold105568_cov37-Tisochrysis_lutea.AAC.1